MQKKLISIIAVVLIVFCLAAAGFSAISLWQLNQEYQAGELGYETIRQRKLALAEDADAPNQLFEALSKRYPGLAAWITVEDTPIDYPVMQAEDNETYLHITAEGQVNSAGSIFLDCRNSAGFFDQNNILFGHALKNGDMFGSLKEYLDPAYRAENPVIILLLPDGEHRYEIFAVSETEAGSRHYTRTPESPAEFIDYLLAESAYDTGVSVSGEDRLLTLSTCTNDTISGRYVVHAREINQ